MRIRAFLTELKRRKVYHVAAAYLAVGVAIAVAVPDLFSTFDLPTSAGRLVIVLIAIGFPIALVLAWAYEVRPEEPPADAAPAARPAAQVVPAPVAADTPTRKSIVVLPFDNMSPDPGDAYFADGLTEEVITDLSCCGLLRVISRNSAMALKGTRKGTKAIAEELKVQYVLEGSVRKAADNLLVTAQLIDATSDEHLWAERFKGTLEDVFEIQGRLARSIVDALKLKLTEQEEEALAARPIEDARAYNTYLLARHESIKLTQQSTDQAIRLVEEAMGVVGENALLCATLAEIHYFAYDMGLRHNQETLESTEKWATKAMLLDPDAGHSHWAMALVHFKQGDLPGYARYGRAAVRLSRDGQRCGHLAVVLACMGKRDEAKRLAEAAVSLDPLYILSHAGWCVVELLSGHAEAASVRISDAVSRLFEGEPFGLWWEAQAAGFAGDDERAQELFERVARMKEAGALANLSRLFLRALEDDAEGVWSALDRPDLRDMGNSDEWFPVYFAGAFARVGELDEAIRWLEQAVTWGFCNHEFLARYDRYLEPLRGHPRFEAVLERAREKERALED